MHLFSKIATDLKNNKDSMDKVFEFVEYSKQILFIFKFC